MGELSYLNKRNDELLPWTLTDLTYLVLAILILKDFIRLMAYGL